MPNTKPNDAPKQPEVPATPKMAKPVVGQFDKNRRKLGQMAKNAKKGQK